MKPQEARAVIEALESGRSFEFHSYAADTRETLVYDGAGDCFILTSSNAYEPGKPERRVFTRDELQSELAANFSYASFHLPPVEGKPATKKKSRSG